MEPSSDNEEKKTGESRDGESTLGQRVAAVLLVGSILVLYISYRLAIDWGYAHSPEWVYYSLGIVGLFVWVGNLLRKASGWIEKDLARMDAKTKAGESKKL